MAQGLAAAGCPFSTRLIVITGAGRLLVESIAGGKLKTAKRQVHTLTKLLMMFLEVALNF